MVRSTVELLLIAPIGFVGGRVAVIAFDRRRRWRKGVPGSPPWTGNCARYQIVDLELDAERAPEIAHRSLVEVGAHPEQPRDGWSWWMGYRGPSWFSWGTEYAIGAQSMAPTHVRLWCCARPRYSLTAFDSGTSRRAAERLARAALKIGTENATRENAKC